MPQNALAAGFPPLTPLGELTAFPQTSLLDLGKGNREGRMEMAREVKGTERGWKGGRKWE